jgi:hypothetical protein
MPVVENLRVLDTLMLDMIACYLSDAIPNVTPQVVYAIDERKYLEYLSGKMIKNENLILPRIALTRGDDDPDSDRQSAAKVIRYHNDEWYRTQYPTPVKIGYEIDFWTQHDWEMAYLRRRMMMFFWNLPPRFLTMNVGGGWGTKYVELYSESGVNMSEREPGEALRTIRYNYSIEMRANIFPLLEGKFLELDSLFYNRSYLIEEIRVEYYDWNEYLWDIDIIT